MYVDETFEGVLWTRFACTQEFVNNCFFWILYLRCVEYNCMYMTISEDLNTAYFMNLISNKRISDSNWRFYIASMF
jgi:hypothetical protein